MLRQLLNRLRGDSSEDASSAQDPAMSRSEAARHDRDARLLALRTEVRSIQQAITDASGSRGDGALNAASEQLDREIAALEVRLEHAQRSLAEIQGRI
jgi:peptidoglycan hydrolase CwlO-like protein